MERTNIVCSHTDLSNKGTNSHAAIDSHIANTAIHQTGGQTAVIEFTDKDGYVHKLTFTNGVATGYTKT